MDSNVDMDSNVLCAILPNCTGDFAICYSIKRADSWITRKKSTQPHFRTPAPLFTDERELTCSATSWLYRWWACCLLLFLDGTCRNESYNLNRKFVKKCWETSMAPCAPALASRGTETSLRSRPSVAASESTPPLSRPPPHPPSCWRRPPSPADRSPRIQSLVPDEWCRHRVSSPHTLKLDGRNQKEVSRSESQCLLRITHFGHYELAR